MADTPIPSTCEAAGCARDAAPAGVPLPSLLIGRECSSSANAPGNHDAASWTGRQHGGDTTNSKGKMSASAARFEPSSFSAPHSSFMTLLNRGSVQDVGLPVIVRSTASHHPEKKDADGTCKDVAAALQKPIGTRSESYVEEVNVYFTTDVGPNIGFMGGHYIKTDKILPADFEPGMSHLYAEFDWSHKIRGQTALPFRASEKFMTIILCFDDLRDAGNADYQITMIKPSWLVTYISQSEYAAVIADAGTGTQLETHFFDGQVVLAATFEGSMSEIDTTGVSDGVRQLASKFGDIFAFKDIAQPSSPSWEFRVEYYKISAAENLLAALTVGNAERIGDWAVTSKRYCGQTKPSPFGNANHMSHIVATPSKGSNSRAIMFCSPTGRTAWSRNVDGSLLLEQPVKTVPKVSNSVMPVANDTPHRGRYQSEPTPTTPGSYFNHMQLNPRSGSWPALSASAEAPQPGHPAQSSESQTVDRDRIISGLDVRTTLMLRNLPNSWDVWQLKAVIDMTSKGEYDFSYLRIDFAHNTNVGYAFVNFIDALCIVDFIDRHIGHEWQPGGVRKLAQVSYATVQGYDCLIEKFRNSAVMDEFPDFRPKLWWTCETAPSPTLIGMEKEFPLANNATKKQRSNDNAGQIGLYAPRSGHRGSDRHRRSQYDRGTTAQIREDAGFVQMSSPPVVHGFRNPGYVTNGFPAIGLPPPPPFPQTFAAANGRRFMDNESQNGQMLSSYRIFADGADPFRNQPSTMQPFQHANGRFVPGALYEGVSPSQTFAALRLSDPAPAGAEARPKYNTFASSSTTPVESGNLDGFQGWLMRNTGCHTIPDTSRTSSSLSAPNLQLMNRSSHGVSARLPDGVNAAPRANGRPVRGSGH